MGIRLVIASSPSVGDVLKAPRIQMTALLCIFPSIFKGYERGALLQNYNWNPYSAIGNMQYLYRRCFWIGLIPHVEFPRSFMHLTMEMALFE